MNLFDTKKNVFTIYLTSDVMLFQNILEDAILGLRPNSAIGLIQLLPGWYKHYNMVVLCEPR